MYIRRTGIQKQRRSVLVRVILPIAFVLTGVSSFALLQVEKQLEAAFKPTSSTEAASVASVPQPSGQQEVSAAQLQAQELPYNDVELQGLLYNWAANHNGVDWSVVVKGLGSDKRSASVRPTSWYEPASLYKLLMMRNLLDRYDLRAMQTQKIWSNNGSQSVKTCVEKMLRYSDNNCAETFARYIGWAPIDSKLKQLGLTQTQLNRKDAQFTNAADMATFLEGLYRGDFVSTAEKDFILSNMQQGNWRKGIPAGCVSCTVANKTGDLPNVRHDVGIVNHKGGSYALVVMTSGASYQQIAELTALIHERMAK